MLFDLPSSINEDSTNIPETESNIKNSPSLYLINDICNPKKDLTLKKVKMQMKMKMKKYIFYLKKTHIDIIIWVIFLEYNQQKKREGHKNIKYLKKQSILIGIKIILQAKFKYIILIL